MQAVRIRAGWGWLLLAAVTLSTIGDEITLITLMFRTAGDRTPFAIPMLLVAQLLPGLLAAPLIGRLVDTRDAGKLLAATALANAVILAWMARHPDMLSTIVGAGILGISFAIGGAASFTLIPCWRQRSAWRCRARTRLWSSSAASACWPGRSSVVRWSHGAVLPTRC